MLKANQSSYSLLGAQCQGKSRVASVGGVSFDAGSNALSNIYAHDVKSSAQTDNAGQSAERAGKRAGIGFYL